MNGLRRGVFASVLALGAVASAREARASGLATARFGGEQGSVVTTNPTALYYNPAGIAFSDGIHLFLDGQIALRSLTWDHAQAPTDPPNPPQSLGNVGHASLFNVFGAPTLGATGKFGDFAFGAGLFVPFGGQESFSTNSGYHNADPTLQGPVDGVQRWHVITAKQAFIYGTAGLAYRLGPLSIGVTGNVIPSSITLTKAQNLAGTQLPNTAAEGRGTLDVSNVFASFGAGLMLEAVKDHLWLGASYQSQPGMGAEKLNGTLTITSGGAMAPPTNVTFNQALPDIVRAGIRWRVQDDLELRLLGDYTRWSVVKSQCVGIQGTPCQVFENGMDASGIGNTILNIRRDWNDTFHVHGGGSYWLKPEIELFAGVGFENAATPNSTLEPSIADASYIEASVGGRFLLFNYLYFAASYTNLAYFNRDNTGQSVLGNSTGPTVQADGGGKYTQWIGAFDVNVEKQF